MLVHGWRTFIPQAALLLAGLDFKELELVGFGKWEIGIGKTVALPDDFFLNQSPVRLQL